MSKLPSQLTSGQNVCRHMPEGRIIICVLRDWGVDGPEIGARWLAAAGCARPDNDRLVFF